MSDLNINSKKWLKKYGDDQGYGSDESLTMSDTGDYSQSTTHRSSSSMAPSGIPKGAATRSTRSGGRQIVKASPPPRVPPPRRRP